jgi:hypothetical protein
MAYRGYHGKYKVKNKEKYVGDIENVVYRSLPERAIMKYFDFSKKILKWNSEGIIIPYLYEVDNKTHRYFMDFYAEIICNDGLIKKYIFEYKPGAKMKKPKKSNRKSNKSQVRYLTEVFEYIKNANKWEYARKYADKNNLIFYVLNEEHIKRMNFFVNL